MLTHSKMSIDHTHKKIHSDEQGGHTQIIRNNSVEL